MIHLKDLDNQEQTKLKINKTSEIKKKSERK